ncbi:FAD-dependent oxidoreductase [Succinivibrio dextrinosolvens]|uniref:FAD-dependent oxidoreductase n=1 Tax=Succinivibrio dextrinosolvens TaxID=83771 RepID=UPI00247A81DA|nr:FAD-dependent oxidoreductase [Succinivibrio dextrinosolvens]
METRKIECHTLIVGAGSAGIEAYKSAVENGADCIIVDSGPVGTTAQRSGELPTSLLMSAAQSLKSLKNLEQCGISFPVPVQPDTSNVLSSLRAVRSRATSDVLSFMYKIPENRRIRGKVKFIDNHNVSVDESIEIHFETAVIATGSSPLVTFEQSRLKNILTSNEFFELETLPKSVAVFGSTKVGLQLGQSLSYLGVDTVVFGQKKLWQLTDESVLLVAHQLLSSRFKLYVDTYVTSMDDDGDNGYTIYYVDGKGYENYLHMESIVAATARIPNVGGMNLQKIGIKLMPHGLIKINEKNMQTSVPNIFAAGDVCRDTFLSSVAFSDGRYAGINAANYPVLSDKPTQVKVNLVYTDPVLAIVGNSLEDMRKYAKMTGDTFITTEVRLAQGHYRGLREDGGILSIYTSVSSHKILGAELCAYKGDKIANFLALAMENNYTVEKLSEYNFANLSAESAIGIAAQNAVDKLKKSNKFRVH